MKLIAAELLNLMETAFRSSFSNQLTHASKEELKTQLTDIEEGGVYARRGITNFLEGDFFRWYLDAWSPRLEKAMGIAQSTGNKKTKGYVWMSLGQVNSARYQHAKKEAVGDSARRASWWLRLAPLRRHGLENYLFFSFKTIKKLRGYISNFTDAFLKAAEIFREINDSAETYAFYNLANNLNTASKFKEARKYLEQAKLVAQKHNERFLLRQIEEMEQIIRDKHKNIPNYLEGETRDFPKPTEDEK